MNIDLRNAVFPSLKKHVVIITGAGPGVGRVFVKALAAASARAVLPAMRKARWGRIVAMQRTPHGETPEDLVGAVLFLASEASAFIFGQAIKPTAVPRIPETLASCL